MTGTTVLVDSVILTAILLFIFGSSIIFRWSENNGHMLLLMVLVFGLTWTSMLVTEVVISLGQSFLFILWCKFDHMLPVLYFIGPFFFG